jgi:hypothetical protein
MWDAYIEFYSKVLDGGGFGIWWAPHNEHRLLLTRLFCWVDLAWLNAGVWPLLVVIYLVVVASAVVFWLMLRELAGTAKPEPGEIVIGLFVTGCLFLWMQFENLTFAVQIQYVLAQFLPLCALHSLHKSTAHVNSKLHFLLACAFGLAAVGTMTNGILALPLMTLYSLLTRQGAVRTCVLATLSLSAILLYFHDYQPPAHHGDFSKTLTEQFPAFCEYILLYLGSPFYYLLGGFIGKYVPALGALGRIIYWFAKLTAILAGLFLLAASARLAIKSLHKPRQATLPLALLFFILYIGGTAFGTAGGRVAFGVDQALSSRYTTSALMAWCALLLLYSPALLAAFQSGSKGYRVPFALLISSMTVFQFSALRSQDEKQFERKIAALALELQVKDQKQVEKSYPDLQRALIIADRASARKISIFGSYPFRDAREHLDAGVPDLSPTSCEGRLDVAESIDGDARLVRVSGWIFDPASRAYPAVIRFLDNKRRVVGYALAGKVRPDLADAIDKRALKAGYTGYVLADQRDSTLTLLGDDPSCQMHASVSTGS